MTCFFLLIYIPWPPHPLWIICTLVILCLSFIASGGTDGLNNTVAVLDLTSMSITGHIDAGKEPDGMAWAVQR